MRHRLLAIACLALLSGCGTVAYTPEEYEIAQGRIAPFEYKGTVTIENIQTDTAQTKFFDGPSQDWAGNHRQVTEHLAEQLRKEIGKNGKAGAGGTKTIKVSVKHLRAEQNVFVFRSTMKVAVQLGDGQPFEKEVSQGSPGNMWRVLNGTIALGVIEILNEEQVRQYLAK